MTKRRRLAAYRKALVALSGALAQLLSLAVLPPSLQAAGSVLLAGLTAGGVVAVKNDD